MDYFCTLIINTMPSTKKTFKIYRNELRDKLRKIYSFEESESIARLAIEDIIGRTRIEYINSLDLYPSESQLIKFNHYSNELLKYRPIQYITGHSEFYGLKFNVNPDVLIPRQETEELVSKIIDDIKHANNINILEIGTGSACIITSIAAKLGNTNSYYATDISEKALKTAAANADNHHASITFLNHDILSGSMIPIDKKIDVLISNPPYVTNKERKEILANVLNYEPASALFVPDNNPLIFYKNIAEHSKTVLNTNAMVYLEINELFGEETANIFKDLGMQTAIIKDFANKDRFVFAKNV
jgi:release factor glutamine methyltransferase